MKIAAIGDNCLDVYVEQNHMTVGGNAVNVAANCELAGHDAVYIGPVGNDKAGSIIRDVYETNGLDLSGIFTLDGKTGVTLIRLIDNDRDFLFEEFGVSEMWDPVLPESLSAHGRIDWVHVGGPRTMNADFASLSKKARIISADISTWTMEEDLDLSDVDVVFASSDVEKGDATAAIGREILARGAREAVVMSGPQGSTWVDADNELFCDATPARRVDTLGAGDSYISGFMLARISGASPEEAMAAGTASATETIQRIGGFPQKPREIPEWIYSEYRDYL